MEKNQVSTILPGYNCCSGIDWNSDNRINHSWNLKHGKSDANGLRNLHSMLAPAIFDSCWIESVVLKILAVGFLMVSPNIWHTTVYCTLHKENDNIQILGILLSDKPMFGRTMSGGNVSRFIKY